MPVLSLYVGEAQISAMKYDGPSDYAFEVFPHVFPKELLKHDFNEEKFYAQVVKFFTQKFEINVESYDLVVGTFSGEVLPISNAKFIDGFGALNEIKDYSWLQVENFAAATKGAFSGFFPIFEKEMFKDHELISYFSNKSLYPQTDTPNVKLKFAHEMLLKNITSKLKFNPNLELPLIFTGSRFMNTPQDPVRHYLTAFGLINTPGVFRTFLDTGNKLPLIALLDAYLVAKSGGPKISKSAKDTITVLSVESVSEASVSAFESEFRDLGTLLNAPGGAEVLFERETGNSQFTEVKENKIFVFPLEPGMTAKVSINGKNIGKLDTYVHGGQLGFIIDGRNYQYDKIDKDWVKVIEERISAF